MTLERGGYHCNESCINNNKGYQKWSIAWDKCRELETCTRVIRWANGSHYYYHLRKADDIFDNNTRFLHVNFHPKCRGKVVSMVRNKHLKLIYRKQYLLQFQIKKLVVT